MTTTTISEEHAADLKRSARTLHNAAQLVQAAARILRTDSVPCDTCGLPHYAQFDEYIEAKNLVKFAEKLHRHGQILGRLSRGEPARRPREEE